MMDVRLYVFGVCLLSLNVFVRNTDAGTVYKTVITDGTGPQPQINQEVVVHYVGTLLNGQQFDSSRDRNEPFKFTLGAGEVIRGWDAVVGSMKVGERATVEIGPEDAYGADGMPPVIPANATLVFDIELLRIELPTVVTDVRTMAETHPGQQFQGQTPFTSLGPQGFGGGDMSGVSGQPAFTPPTGMAGMATSGGMTQQNIQQTQQPWQATQGFGQDQSVPQQPWQMPQDFGANPNTQQPHAWSPSQGFGATGNAPQPPPQQQQPWQTSQTFDQGNQAGLPSPMDTSMASQGTFQGSQGMPNIFPQQLPNGLDFQGLNPQQRTSFLPQAQQPGQGGMSFMGPQGGMPGFQEPGRSTGTFQDIPGRGGTAFPGQQPVPMSPFAGGRPDMLPNIAPGSMMGRGIMDPRLGRVPGPGMPGQQFTRISAQRGAGAVGARDFRMVAGFPGMPVRAPGFAPGMAPGFRRMPIRPFMRPGMSPFLMRRMSRRRGF